MFGVLDGQMVCLEVIFIECFTVLNYMALEKALFFSKDEPEDVYQRS